MNRLILLLLFCQLASAANHSLKILLTATAGISNFPDFVAVVLVDEVEVGYYDSNRKRPEPKTTWMKKILMENLIQITWYLERTLHHQNLLKGIIDNLKQRFNQYEGAIVLQRISGCEWDDETEDIRGFNKYGYNGEDFIIFDLETMMWIAQNPQADSFKHEWDQKKDTNRHWRHILTNECPEYLKKFVKRAQQKSVLPSVSLLQKTPSSPVSCFATGFYPDRAEIFWRKDGEEIHEDVELGEILPNHDGSFQMNVDLNISSVTPEDWRRYECVFRLSSVKDDIITKLNKTVINLVTKVRVPPSEFPTGPVIGAVVGLLLLLAVCITGVFIWRRRKNGFSPVNESELPTIEPSRVKDADT